MPQGIRGLIGMEDLVRHNPGTSTAQQTIQRTKSNGAGFNTISALGANSWPLLDAPYGTATSPTPFEFSGSSAVAMPDTTAKNAEWALQQVRLYSRQGANFESHGGKAGSVTLSEAANNTAVFFKIVSDMVIRGRIIPIFFPGSLYEFSEFGGQMPNITNLNNVVLAGSGKSTRFKQHGGSAGPGTSLMVLTDCIGSMVVDIQFEKTSTVGGYCLEIVASANPISDIIVDNCGFTSGAGGLNVDGLSKGSNRAWISRNSTSNQGIAPGISVSTTTGLRLMNNVTTGTGGGMYVQSSGGTSRPLQDCIIQGNYLAGPNHYLSVARSGTYDSSVHKGIKILDNQISSGDIQVSGVNEVEISRNNMFSGGISLAHDAGMVSASRLKIKENSVLFGSVFTNMGIEVLGTTVTMSGFEIENNSIVNASRNGIRIAFSTSPALYGRVFRNMVLNNSRYDAAANTFSSILYEGTGGVRESTTMHNTCRNTAATVGFANKQKYGYEETGGTTGNFVGENWIKGFATGVALFAGTTTATWAGGDHQTGASPFNGGAAV